MTQSEQLQDNEEPDDGFNVVHELPLSKWLDFGFSEFGEYVHLIPDRENRELRCYRTISKATERNERIKTTIEDVHFTYRWDEEQTEITKWYLTYMEAKSVMSFFDLMNRTRQGVLSLEWYEKNNSPMVDESNLNVETLTFEFTKENGVTRNLQIHGVWQSRKSHTMAGIKGASY